VAAPNGTEKDFSLELSIVMRLCYTLKHCARTDSGPERGTVLRIDLEPHEDWSGFVDERQD